MEKFTASNGLVLVPHADGSVRWEAGFQPRLVTAALREFFQHERDQELGRWRWPENPDYVVYHRAHGMQFVHVLHEPSTGTDTVHREDAVALAESESEFVQAARAYFAAHPEPKPWHDAKPGEVWLIGVPAGPTFEFSAMTAVEHDGKIAFSNPGSDEWLAPTYEPHSARRIWPEVPDA